MATRDDIAAIYADAEGDKRGRVSRLNASRLRTLLANNLPFTWKPPRPVGLGISAAVWAAANVSVTINAVALRANLIAFWADMTIRGETKSLSTWIEGEHSPPDWQLDPPLFVDDPTGDVTFQMDDGTVRRGRDDLVAAMRYMFVSTFGAKIADLVRQ